MRKKKILPFVISLVLFFAILWYANTEKILETILKANVLYLTLGILLWVITSLIRTLRWHIYLSHVGVRIKIGKLYPIYVAGMFISNLSPGKAGDIAKPLLLKFRYGIELARTIPSIVIEKMIDIVILTIPTILIVILYLYNFPISFRLVLFSVVIYFGLFLLAIFVLSSKNRTERFLTCISKPLRFLPHFQKILREIRKFSKTLTSTFKKYRERNVILKGLLVTSLIWLLESLFLFTAFASIGKSVNLLHMYVVIAISVLVAVITFLPGGIGSSELVQFMFISSFYTFKPWEIMSAILIARILGYWNYAFFGSLFSGFLLPSKNVKKRQKRK